MINKKMRYVSHPVTHVSNTSNAIESTKFQNQIRSKIFFILFCNYED